MMTRNQILIPSLKRIGQKVIIIVDVIVFTLFWLMVLSDFSLYDNQMHLSFSVLVVCLTTITFIMLFKSGWYKFLAFLICSILFLATICGIPFHRYHSSVTPIQIVMSPDGTRFIEAYCSFTNAHATGFDHIEIIVRNNNTPFLQRDLGLYNNYIPRHCVGYSNDLVRWEDNNTIYVVERKAYLTVGNVKWDGFITSPGEIRSD